MTYQKCGQNHSVLKSPSETLRITCLVLLSAADTKIMPVIERQKIGNGELIFLSIFKKNIKKNKTKQKTMED